jgi:iron(III) transport system substrate-binding protein
MKSVKWGVLFAIVLALSPGIVFAEGQPEAEEVGPESGLPVEVADWLREHQIGPFQEEVTDYDALYQRALQEEGPVVVYASSSRGPASLEQGFYEKYPGIEVEWNTIGTSGGIERLITEQKAGAYTADILFVSDFSNQVNVLNKANMVFGWVPSELRDKIPPEFQDPLLAHRYEARVVFYNDHELDQAPIDSWWDLTTEEWRGKVVLVDPRTDGSTLDLMTTIVLNADEMARDYRRVFGKEIELTTENAGYEFIKRFAENDPALIDGDKKGRFIGEPQENPPVGVSFAFSRIRDSGDPEHGDLSWSVAVDLKPRVGMLYPSGANIAYRAPHPNSAKLVIRWLLGDEEGGQGMSPWFVPGNWPSRIDVTATPDHPFQEGKSWAVGDLNLWYMDSRETFKIQNDVLEFVQVHF